MKRIALALILTACGTDPSEGIPTTLTADAKTGEVSLKGEKGDRGDEGETGAAGKDGTNGTSGKDGVNGTNGKDGAAGKDGAPAEPVDPPSIWKDPVSGRRWMLLSGRHSFASGTAICETWRLGTATELALAVRRGITRALTATNPVAQANDEWAVSSTESVTVNQYMAISLLGAEGVFAEKQSKVKTDAFRVFCTKD